MRAILIVLVVVALAAAGGVSYFANQLLSSAERVAAPAEPEPAPVTRPTLVAVAAADMTAGHTLSADGLRWQPWPEDAVRDSYLVVRPDDPDPAGARETLATRFAGMVVRHPVAAGQPLTEALVFTRGDAGFMAGVLEPGHRAVAVPVSQESAVAGFILPGDRVDVMLSLDLRNDRDDSGEVYEKLMGTVPIVRYVAETVIEDVRVLGLDQQMTQPEEGTARVSSVATLEVTPAEAEALTIVGRMGALSLALRGLGDRQVSDAGTQPDGSAAQAGHQAAAAAAKADDGRPAPAGDVTGHNAGDAAAVGRRDARAFVGDLHVSNTLATMMTTFVAQEMAAAQSRWDVVIHRGAESGSIQTFRRQGGSGWLPGPEVPYGTIPAPGDDETATPRDASQAAPAPVVAPGNVSRIATDVLRGGGNWPQKD